MKHARISRFVALVVTAPASEAAVSMNDAAQLVRKAGTSGKTLEPLFDMADQKAWPPVLRRPAA